jgi:hypothetical protein
MFDEINEKSLTTNYLILEHQTSLATSSLKIILIISSSKLSHYA